MFHILLFLIVFFIHLTFLKPKKLHKHIKFAAKLREIVKKNEKKA